MSTEQAAETPKSIAISFLLDRSGSMACIRQATVDGINSFVQEQQKHGVPTTFSLTLFDSFETDLDLDHVIDSKPISEISNMETFSPRGNTPLNDAFYDTISWFEKRVEGKDVRVLFVVMTDGEENSSKKQTAASLKARVEKKTQEGWEFIYLGANQDAYAVAGRMGVAAGNTQNYQATAQGVARASMNLTNSSVAYASAGSSYKSGNFFGEVADADMSVPPPPAPKAKESGIVWKSKV